MNFEIVTLPGFKVIGKEVRTTNKHLQCATDIGHAWHEAHTKQNLTHIPHPLAPHTLIGLYTDYSPEISATNGYYTFIAGVPVTEIESVPQGMVSREIPGQKYAVFTAQGPFEKSIGKVWFEEVWKCTAIERAFTFDFELYDAKSTNNDHSIVKIYIAIK